MTIDSTINDSAYYNSDKNDAEGNPKSDPLVATHTSDVKNRKVTDTDTTNGNSPQKILIDRTLLIIIPPIDPRIADGVAADIGTAHARQTPTLKVIVTDAARSSARIFRNPGDVSLTVRYGNTPRDGNTYISPPRFNYPVLVGTGTTISPTRTGIQEIGSPKGPTGPVEVKNSQIFHTSINGYLTDNRDSTPTFSKLIRLELSHNSSANIYLHCQVNFMRNSIGTKSPNFTDLGILAVYTSDELGSFDTPATRVGRPTDGSNLSAPGHVFVKATVAGASGMRT